MTARLDEYDKDEFRDIMRVATKNLGGKLDEAKFEKDWAEFLELKRKKTQQ